MEYNTSPHNTGVKRVTIFLPEHHYGKLQVLCKMFNQKQSALISLIIDQMYYEPISPDLPKTINNANQRVFAFFRRSSPGWVNRMENY